MGWFRVKSQVTQATNAPNGVNYVGFNNQSNDPLRIRNIGDPRMHISTNGLRKITIDELPVWNGLNGLSENHAQRTTLGLNGEGNQAWSMLHW